MPFHESIQVYISAVCKQVRWKKAHLPIAAELLDHIEDQAAAYAAEGVAEDEARAKAVEAMGDPIHIGTLLDASYRPQLPWALLFSLGALIILGLILRNSLLTAPATTFSATEALALLLGLAGFFLIYNLDWRLLLKMTWVLYGGLVLLSFLPLLFPSWPRGLRPDILYQLSGRGYSLTPSLLLFFPAVYGLIIYQFRGKGLKHVLLCGALFILPGFFWTAQPNWGLMLRTALPCLAILTIAICGGHFKGSKRRALLFVWGGTLLALVLGIAFFLLPIPYRLARLRAATPWGADSDPLGAGYFALLVRGFLEHAKLFGTGEVTTPSTLDILERTAAGKTFGDLQVSYALSLFIHRYGWWVLAALCAFLGWLFFFLFRACRRQGSMLGKLLGYGATLALLVQFLSYILSNLGFVMFDALPLPFLTAGNSALMVDIWLAGLLTAVLAGGATLRDGILGQEKGWKPAAPKAVASFFKEQIKL